MIFKEGCKPHAIKDTRRIIGLHAPLRRHNSRGRAKHSDLTKLVAALDAAQPADIPTIEKLIGQTLKCIQAGTSINCDLYNITVGKAKISHLNYREAQLLRGLLIVEGFGGDCISLPDAGKMYGAGKLAQTCTDVGICWYQKIERPWGRMSLRVSGPGDQCATSVIFEDDPPR